MNKKVLKNFKLIVLLGVLGSLFLLTGCQEKLEKSNSDAENNIFSNYGRYEIPDGWIKNEEHSSKYKQFYIKQIDNDKSRPNNISVNGGTNYYSKDQHELFRQAILEQLGMQVNKDTGLINGNGGTTSNGYVVYTFTIDNKNSKTVQHYIVGDYKFLLVHETIFDDETKDIDECAKYIVNTFKWNN